jgi:transcription initiation factor TFIID subunit 7
MSSDDSDDYAGPRRGSGVGRGRGRGRGRGKRGGIGAADLSSHTLDGAPSNFKLKVKTGGGNVQGKRSAKGGFVIASGKEANVPPQWQGYGDRELDSDTEEPLVFEESFILRMPIPTNLDQENELQRFADMVKKREPMDEKDVWFKFMDSRRAVFNLGKTMYNAKLVDLPCIIEPQKTNDNKHIFKTADVSQVRPFGQGH